jgi:hypothetical protein
VFPLPDVTVNVSPVRLLIIPLTFAPNADTEASENNAIRLIKLVLACITTPFHNAGFTIRACAQNVVDVPYLFADAGLRGAVFFLARAVPDIDKKSRPETAI